MRGRQEDVNDIEEIPDPDGITEPVSRRPAGRCRAFPYKSRTGARGTRRGAWRAAPIGVTPTHRPWKLQLQRKWRGNDQLRDSTEPTRSKSDKSQG